jgi:ankyrin repeat protein
MPKSLPAAPSLKQLRKQAKDLLSSFQQNDAAAADRFKQHLPRPANASPATSSVTTVNLSDAQLVIAREYGFASWPKLKIHVEILSSGRTPLRQQELDEAMIRAANKEKDLTLVQELLDAGANINGRLAEVGTTALGWAACGGHIILMNYLLERGANVDMAANGDCTALMCAAGMGQPDAVELLLARGASANAPQPGNYSPLHAGTYGGNDKVVRLLLKAGAEVNTQTTEGQFGQYWFYLPYCGETPLHNAMAYGSREMIEMLLAAGADIGMRTRHGEHLFIGQAATRNSAPGNS